MNQFLNSVVTGAGMGFGLAISVVILRVLFKFQFC